MRALQLPTSIDVIHVSNPKDKKSSGMFMDEIGENCINEFIAAKLTLEYSPPTTTP